MTKSAFKTRRARLIAALSLAGFSILTGHAVSGDTTYKYDDLGRLAQVNHPNGQQTSYSYDLADNRTSAVTSSSGSASGNSPPTCPSFSYTVNPPTNNPVSVAVPVGSGCTDPDGDAITTSPAAPYSITIGLHSTVTVTYTASDGHGHTVSATITVIRP